MKLGCVVWCFTETGDYKAPYEKAIKTVGDLGFKGIELIAGDEDDLDNYYTPTKIKELRNLYESYNMKLSNFAIFHPMIDELGSLDPILREQALEKFKKCAKVGKELGAPLINTVSQHAVGFEAPVSYISLYLTPLMMGHKISPKLKMKIPEDFDHEKIWNTYVESLKQCLEIAEDNNMKFAIEAHPYMIINGIDSILRLLDRIPSENFGVLYDIAGHLTVREYPPMTILTLNKRLLDAHARDGDGLSNYNLPPGMGIIDWDEMFMAFKKVDYKGFLSIELSHYGDPIKYVSETKKYLEEHMALAGIS